MPFDVTLPNVLRQSPIREAGYLQSLFQEGHLVFVENCIEKLAVR